MELAPKFLTHIIVEVAKALAGSFKLVTLTPKKTAARGNIKEWRHTNKSKSTNEHTKHKPRLNTQESTLGPTGLYELVLVAVHMENIQCTAPKCQGPLQLLSPPFLMTSTTKQMRPNGRGEA